MSRREIKRVPELGGGSHSPEGRGRKLGWAEAEVRAVACGREEGSRIEENFQTTAEGES